MSLNLPPFHGAVKTLVLANVGMFVLQLLAEAFSRTAASLLAYLALVPSDVMHGLVFQAVTYGFLHLSIWQLLFNMLALWMLGGQLEGDWGKQKFYEFYFFCLIASALVAIAVAYSHLLGASPLIRVMGSSAPIMGLTAAFGTLYAEQELMMILPPISMKAKYMAIIFVVVELLFTLIDVRMPGQIAVHASLLSGALFGWVYVRYFPRRGMRFMASERYYGIRNSYYKWKRRRAAKKFEVYMRKHDKNEYFDQYGNYKAPDDKEKGNGESGSGGWVN
jgi:membrane associated rhomboid family serine protease